jgi:hypothetical protein
MYRVVKLDNELWGVQQKVLLWWLNYSVVQWVSENNFHSVPEKIPVAFFSEEEAEDFVELLNNGELKDGK